MNYVIEGEGALVNEKGEEIPLKAGDFALVNPEGLTQVIQMKNISTATKAINLSR
jgi:uncharacterized cupin superfamily protein